MSFPAITRAMGSDGSAIITDEWMQGRTAYGGLSAAIAAHAALASADDLPPLRSAQIAFVGPLSGRVRASPQLLRRGKNSAFVACPVESEAGVGVQSLFLFMASRPSTIAHSALAMPDTLFDDTALFDSSRFPQGFLRNFDIQRGDPSGFAGGIARRWIRLAERDGLHPAVELMAIADALPPAAMSLAKQWGPISTTTWQLNIVVDRPQTRDGWWLLEAQTLEAANGNSSQAMTIWNRDGALMATAIQSIALFV